ncbi:hypothetical protein [Clostridioides difficile]|uniref:hypothetical protein n=1 Tax=Clostridioides difficile TaxID=1496 RepID=UPI000D1DC704|nr:hypothetical protein [Clostridioides difficile]HBE9444505.1 hypothetical protein [Clostridioides difficile]
MNEIYITIGKELKKELNEKNLFRFCNDIIVCLSRKDIKKAHDIINNCLKNNNIILEKDVFENTLVLDSENYNIGLILQELMQCDEYNSKDSFLKVGEKLKNKVSKEDCFYVSNELITHLLCEDKELIFYTMIKWLSKYDISIPNQFIKKILKSSISNLNNHVGYIIQGLMQDNNYDAKNLSSCEISIPDEFIKKLLNTGRTTLNNNMSYIIQELLQDDNYIDNDKYSTFLNSLKCKLSEEECFKFSKDTIESLSYNDKDGLFYTIISYLSIYEINVPKGFVERLLRDSIQDLNTSVGHIIQKLIQDTSNYTNVAIGKKLKEKLDMKECKHLVNEMEYYIARNSRENIFYIIINYLSIYKIYISNNLIKNILSGSTFEIESIVKILNK